MIPEVVVVGDTELLFLGLALGAGAPKAARRILRTRYGVKVSADESKDDSECCCKAE